MLVCNLLGLLGLHGIHSIPLTKHYYHYTILHYTLLYHSRLGQVVVPASDLRPSDLVLLQPTYSGLTVVVYDYVLCCLYLCV